MRRPLLADLWGHHGNCMKLSSILTYSDFFQGRGKPCCSLRCFWSFKWDTLMVVSWIYQQSPLHSQGRSPIWLLTPFLQISNHGDMLGEPTKVRQKQSFRIAAKEFAKGMAWCSCWPLFGRFWRLLCHLVPPLGVHETWWSISTHTVWLGYFFCSWNSGSEFWSFLGWSGLPTFATTNANFLGRYMARFGNKPESARHQFSLIWPSSVMCALSL